MINKTSASYKNIWLLQQWSSYHVLTSNPPSNKISPYSELKLPLLISGISISHPRVLKIWR